MIIEYYDVPNDYMPAYGNIPEHLKRISFRTDNIRKLGCTWLINGERCAKPCMSFIMYCSDHKDIPDIKRVIHEPITTCIKRNIRITNNIL
jgi:hypothetical protein